MRRRHRPKLPRDLIYLHASAPHLLDRPEQLHFLPSLPGNFHVMRHDAGLASTLHFHSPLRGSLETPGKTLSALYEMVDSREKKSEHKMREVSH
jgi:hypothetical protein